MVSRKYLMFYLKGKFVVIDELIDRVESLKKQVNDLQDAVIILFEAVFQEDTIKDKIIKGIKK